MRTLRSWSVEVDVVDVVPDAITDEMTAQLAEHLAGAGGVVASHPARPNWWGVRIAVEASTPTEAIDEAMRLTTKAVRKTGIAQELTIDGIEVRSFEALEAELAKPAFPELLGITEIGELLGVSRQRASQIAGTKAFPVPAARLASGPVWTAPGVARFVERWERKPGRPRGFKMPAIATEVA